MARGCLVALLIIAALGFGLWAAFLYVIDLPAYHTRAVQWQTIIPHLIIAAGLAILAIRLAFPSR